MRQAERPGLGVRMRAAIASERSAEVLEAMRAAGRAVLDEVGFVDAVRKERASSGTGSWDARPAVASHLVATYHALLLQTLGEELLDSDYRSDPGTRGYVPEPIFTQVWWWFSAVPQWLSRARQARSNPDYDLRHELRLPVDLPPWHVDEETLARYVDALLATVARMRPYAEGAVSGLAVTADPARLAIANTLRQRLAAADSAMDYAAGARRASSDARLLGPLWEELNRAIDSYCHVGQLAEFPVLLATPPVAGTPVAHGDPGGTQIDPWCLTDPETVGYWRAQPSSCQEIDEMWAADPEPAATVGVKAEIDAAVAAGDVVRVKLPNGATSYYRCPWSSLYEVRRPVTIHGLQLAVGQQFAFDVSAELVPGGGPFVRALVPGPFQAW